MRLEQHRRRRREEDEARDALAPVPGEVAHRLAPRHRMGDQREARKIEAVDERGDVVGERVEVIAAGRLIGAAVAAAVEGDAAEALFGERGHLVVPHSAGCSRGCSGTGSARPLPTRANRVERRLSP